MFLLLPNRWCSLRTACIWPLLKALKGCEEQTKGQISSLASKLSIILKRICVQSLSATTNYLYTIQVITGSGQGLQTILITSLCDKDPPALAGSTQAGQLKYPWRQDSPGPTSTRNGKPATAQACQLLPVAVRTAWEFIMLVTSSASCIHTSLLPE